MDSRIYIIILAGIVSFAILLFIKLNSTKEGDLSENSSDGDKPEKHKYQGGDPYQISSQNRVESITEKLISPVPVNESSYTMEQNKRLYVASNMQLPKIIIPKKYPHINRKQYQRDISCKESSNQNEQEKLPYRSAALLTKTECLFYPVLRSTIPDNRQINCKTRMEDIANVDKKILDKDTYKDTYRNKVKSRHIDFIVYDPMDGQIDFAVELDDPSHDNEEQKKIDSFKDDVFEKIGIPLIRIRAQHEYRQSDISEIVKNIQIALCKQ